MQERERNNMERTSQRIEWIDISKGITIYLMVLYHVGTSHYLDTYIHVFHMPIFFILSGYCFNEEKSKDLMKLAISRFKTLMIPYFVFGAGLFLFWNISLYVLKRPDEMRTIQNLLCSIFGNVATASAFGVIQWFLPCLFLTEIMFAVLVRATCSSTKLMGVLIISLIGWLYPHLTKTRPLWAFDCALMATGFYGLGWLLKKRSFGIELKNHILKTRTTVLLLILACITIPTVFLNGYVNMRVTIYGNYLLYIFNATAVSLMVVGIAMTMEKVFKNSKFTRTCVWIGKNTLIILLLNSTFIRAWEVVFGNALSGLSKPILYFVNAVVAVVVTLAGALMSEFVNRYMPWIVGKVRK